MTTQSAQSHGRHSMGKAFQLASQIVCFVLMLSLKTQAVTILFEDFEDTSDLTITGNARHWGNAPLDGPDALSSGFEQGGSQSGSIFFGANGYDSTARLTVDVPNLAGYSDLELTMSLAAPAGTRWESTHRDSLIIRGSTGLIDSFMPLGRGAPLTSEIHRKDLSLEFQDFTYSIDRSLEDITFAFASTGDNEYVGIDSLSITGRQGIVITPGNQIDFGTLQIDSPQPSVNFSIANLSSPDPNASLSLDSFLISGDAHILTTDLHSFSGLSPGESKEFTASMATDRFGSFSSNIVLNFSDGLGLEQMLNLSLSGEIPFALQAGDANQDLEFSQEDLLSVLLTNKYLTGEPATWGEGDWDGAPGGMPGDPPAGNGLFDQQDIIAALSAGAYLTGPYAAVGNDIGVVPEPSALLLFCLGAMGIVIWRRRPDL